MGYSGLLRGLDSCAPKLLNVANVAAAGAGGSADDDALVENLVAPSSVRRRRRRRRLGNLATRRWCTAGVLAGNYNGNSGDGDGEDERTAAVEARVRPRRWRARKSRRWLRRWNSSSGAGGRSMRVGGEPGGRASRTASGVRGAGRRRRAEGVLALELAAVRRAIKATAAESNNLAMEISEARATLEENPLVETASWCDPPCDGEAPSKSPVVGNSANLGPQDFAMHTKAR